MKQLRYSLFEPRGVVPGVNPRLDLNAIMMARRWLDDFQKTA